MVPLPGQSFVSLACSRSLPLAAEPCCDATTVAAVGLSALGTGVGSALAIGTVSGPAKGNESFGSSSKSAHCLSLNADCLGGTAFGADGDLAFGADGDLALGADGDFAFGCR